MLLNFGFKIQYISIDGVQINRDFFKFLLLEFKIINLKICLFRNFYNFEEEVVFIMDFFYVVKKVRNNILKSGKEVYCKCYLKLVDQFIEWNYFICVYL